METISIKGKKYVTVNERLKEFRKNFAGYSLVTIVRELTNDVCVMEAQIRKADGTIVANGFAREVRTQAGSLVNATSYVENCETSAWGRALGNFGIGIDESICSAQELLVALGMQDKRTQAVEVKAEPKTEPQQVQLTERELEELDQAYALMDAATSKEDLNNIYARFKAAPFADRLKAHGFKVKSERGW